jgi:hypothetical protein
MPSLKGENTILTQESKVISSERYSLPWQSIALVELQLKIRQKNNSLERVTPPPRLSLTYLDLTGRKPEL